MASIANEPGGKRRVLYVSPIDGKRRTIRLGKTPIKAAEQFCAQLEALLAARSAGAMLDARTAQWLADVPDRMHATLAKQGLVEPRSERVTITLDELIGLCIDAMDAKPTSIVRVEQARRAMTDHFRIDRDADSITHADADDWRKSLSGRFAGATISRTIRYARQFYRWGVKRGLVKSNPFDELRAGSQVNPENQVFVDRATIERVIDAAPDAEWRALIALSRFGGLRVPSEALALRWTDIDWDHNRITVRSPKTEHHEGKAQRSIPLFPELRGPLLDLFALADEGAEHVITRYRAGSNLNPQFRRIIERAGVAAWPRAFHNLRGSRQTELAHRFPLATVCDWIGYSKLIAQGHYLQQTDADWERALESGAESGALVAQNPAQHTPAPRRKNSKEATEVSIGGGFTRDSAQGGESTQKQSVGRPGLEPGTPAFSMPCSTN